MTKGLLAGQECVSLGNCRLRAGEGMQRDRGLVTGNTRAVGRGQTM